MAIYRRYRGQHVTPWSSQDYRGSKVRARSIVTGDLALRVVYLEALFAMRDTPDGMLPGDPEALTDILGVEPDEVARCLKILDKIARIPGSRGGLLLEGGFISNRRTLQELSQLQEYLEASSEGGRRSAEVRRQRFGTAKPPSGSVEGPSKGGSTPLTDDLKGGSTPPEGSLNMPSRSHSLVTEPPFNPPAPAGGSTADPDLPPDLDDEPAFSEPERLATEARVARERILRTVQAAGVRTPRQVQKQVFQRLMAGDPEAEVQADLLKGAHTRAAAAAVNGSAEAWIEGQGGVTHAVKLVLESTRGEDWPAGGSPDAQRAADALRWCKALDRLGAPSEAVYRILGPFLARPRPLAATESDAVDPPSHPDPPAFPNPEPDGPEREALGRGLADLIPEDPELVRRQQALRDLELALKKSGGS